MQCYNYSTLSQILSLYDEVINAFWSKQSVIHVIIDILINKTKLCGKFMMWGIQEITVLIYEIVWVVTFIKPQIVHFIIRLLNNLYKLYLRLTVFLIPVLMLYWHYVIWLLVVVLKSRISIFLIMLNYALNKYMFLGNRIVLIVLFVCFINDVTWAEL